MKQMQHYDVAIVGAGMAGSIIAARCGEAGLRTLVLETGRTVTQAPLAPRSLMGKIKRRLRQRPDPQGERWPRTILIREGEQKRYRETMPFLGRGPGGSGRIYGAALGRAQADDFETSWDPADWFPGALPPLPNSWPLDFAAFGQWYRQAEEMLRVVGTRDPLCADDDAELGAPPGLSPAHELIVERLRANGRHPYRMHVGISYLPGCWECQGITCPRDCKSHGYNRALTPALAAGAPIDLREQVTVQRVARIESGALVVEAVDRGGDPVHFLTRQVVLAAGALNSPLVLQRSASLWDGQLPALVGAGLMFHSSEIFTVSGFDGKPLYGPRKVLAFRDHYRDGAMPLAECQSLGMVVKAGDVGSYLYARASEMGFPHSSALQLALRVAAEFAARHFAESELFTAALEDLPYPDNRVETRLTEDGSEAIAITYHARPEMIARSKRFRQLMKEAFAPFKLNFLTRPGAPNLGHPMGSCRMGREREISVVDPDCQVWDQEGLYVADASVFPSSLGLNPALTVAANALRVAETLVSRAKAVGRSPRRQPAPSSAAAPSA